MDDPFINLEFIRERHRDLVEEASKHALLEAMKHNSEQKMTGAKLFEWKRRICRRLKRRGCIFFGLMKHKLYQR